MYRIYKTVTNTTNIINIKVQEAHQDTAPMAIIEAENTSLSNGDAVEIYLGYVGDYDKVFSGYVKEVTRSTPPTKYKIAAYGVMVRASDYFIASTNPDNPYTKRNITAEALVGDILALAGITNYGYEATSFTFGTQSPVEVNLVSAYEFCHMVANTLAWHLYADQNDKAWFVERWNGLMDTDSSSRTVDNTKLINASRNISTRDLRNRIVVYGRNGIHAEEKTSSPHLPSGFYQSVVASADWIDTQQMANLTAERNLDLLNKLGESVQITMLGDSSYQAREIVEFNYSNIGASGDWYVESVNHNLSNTSGFTTQLSLKK